MEFDKLFEDIINGVPATVRLLDMYDPDELDDETEEIYNYVDTEEDLKKEFPVKTMSPAEASKLKTPIGDMTIVDAFKDFANREQKALVKHKQKNFDNNRIVVVCNDTLVDGNHHAMAAILSGKPVKFINLADGAIKEGRLGRLASGAALGLSLLGGTPDIQAKEPMVSTGRSDKQVFDDQLKVFYKTYAEEMKKLIKAIIQVESGGNDKAVGDNGKALGAFQIHKEVVDDYNRWMGTKLKHEDMFDRVTAEEVCRKYLSVYGRIYQKKTGKFPTIEVLARIWNGGPDGWKNPNTDVYAGKVIKLL